MFGHLKAEDFMNLIEGAPLPGRAADFVSDLVTDKQRRHLESCARCANTLKSLAIVRTQVTEMQAAADEHIPEPDWTEFRMDIRDALLSRSVRRESTHRTWLGGVGWKPVAAFGFSILLLFGLVTRVVLRDSNSTAIAGVDRTPVAQVAPAEFADSSAAINAIAGLVQPDVFDDLINLDENETENLKLILEDLTREGGQPQ